MKLTVKLKPYKQYLLIAAILVLAINGRLQSKDLNAIIKSFCLEGFKKEFINNNETMNLELGEYICNCFVKRINKNENIDSALEKCKEEALDKFGYKTI